MAGKDVNSQLLFKLQDGLADAWLGGVQRLGRLGQIELAAHGLLNKAELVQVHDWRALAASIAIASMTESASPMAERSNH